MGGEKELLEVDFCAAAVDVDGRRYTKVVHEHGEDPTNQSGPREVGPNSRQNEVGNVVSGETEESLQPSGPGIDVGLVFRKGPRRFSPGPILDNRESWASDGGQQDSCFDLNSPPPAPDLLSSRCKEHLKQDLLSSCCREHLKQIKLSYRRRRITKPHANEQNIVFSPEIKWPNISVPKSDEPLPMEEGKVREDGLHGGNDNPTVEEETSHTIAAGEKLGVDLQNFISQLRSMITGEES
ncbi:hypothetical protein Hanom_Chr03g00261591 [Helianthus anomalus]